MSSFRMSATMATLGDLPELPRSMHGTCEKPGRFVRLCETKVHRFSVSDRKRSGRHAMRRSGYTVIEQRRWNGSSV